MIAAVHRSATPTADKEKYKEEAAAYKASNGQKKWLETARAIRKSRPPKTGYLVFTKENFAAVVKKDPQGKMTIKKVAEMWKKLDPAKKEKINKKSHDGYVKWQDDVQKKYYA